MVFEMFVHVIFQALPILLVGGTAQYMQQMPQQQYPYYQSQPQHMIQMQMPNGLPGPLPPGMQQPMLPNMPHMPGLHAPMNMPPMQLPLTGGRLPMVVMPHHTKKKEKKKSKKSRKRSYKRKSKKESASSDDSCDSESGYDFRKNNNKSPKKKRREVLTPVVSYITKDGYVVYQKKIKKEKAKDWLELSKASSDEYGKKNKVKTPEKRY